MKEVHSAEDLKNFIHESKPDEYNIIKGYLFSGKKHLLYEALNLNIAPFSIVYHKNIPLDENHGKERVIRLWAIYSPLPLS